MEINMCHQTSVPVEDRFDRRGMYARSLGDVFSPRVLITREFQTKLFGKKFDQKTSNRILINF